MDSYSNRLTTLGSWYSTACFILMGLIALSGYSHVKMGGGNDGVVVHVLKPNQIKLKPMRIGRDTKAKKPLVARLSFDLDADLSSLFSWNTKMLFVSVLAEFKNDEYNFNQVCIWDDVIRNKEDAILNLKKKQGEYPVHDIANKLAGSKANLTLQYEIVPWIGVFLQERKVFMNAITFPAAE